MWYNTPPGIYKDTILTPDIAAKEFTYLKDGRLVWSKTDFQKFGMDWERRGYGKPSYASLKNFLNDRSLAVLLEINHNHWVALDNLFSPKTGKGYPAVMCIDPYPCPAVMKKINFSQISGFSLFRRMD